VPIGQVVFFHSAFAPFDYTTILWAVLVGYFMVGEVPATVVFVGRRS
jgi:hypothetical protein